MLPDLAFVPRWRRATMPRPQFSCRSLAFSLCRILVIWACPLMPWTSRPSWGFAACQARLFVAHRYCLLRNRRAHQPSSPSRPDVRPPGGADSRQRTVNWWMHWPHHCSSPHIVSLAAGNFDYRQLLGPPSDHPHTVPTVSPFSSAAFSALTCNPGPASQLNPRQRLAATSRHRVRPELTYLSRTRYGQSRVRGYEACLAAAAGSGRASPADKLPPSALASRPQYSDPSHWTPRRSCSYFTRVWLDTIK